MMHLNSYGLWMNGFKLVASYTCITKGKKALHIDCYTNGNEYLVRTFETGRTAWDSLYTNKEEANASVSRLFKLYSFHKKNF